MLKVRKENFDALVDYGFTNNDGVYSYTIDDSFTLFVNMFEKGKGIVEDGIDVS